MRLKSWNPREQHPKCSQLYTRAREDASVTSEFIKTEKRQGRNGGHRVHLERVSKLPCALTTN